MTQIRNKKQIAEFGDFQTPQNLADKACVVLSQKGIKPASIVEPTCGLGNFLFSALDQFPLAKKAIGVEIHSEYIKKAKEVAKERKDSKKISIINGDFFSMNWESVLKKLPQPILVAGNLPWVTNAHLSSLGSTNIPEKSNFQGLNGIEARTGKSNFDISEWMMIQILRWLTGQDATMAMLCKTSVARKILYYASKHRITIEDVFIYRIDAVESFGASVDACLFVCQFASTSAHNSDALVYETLDNLHPHQIIGVREGRLIASVDLYEKWKHLAGSSPFKWRSGIKHDCSKVMELVREGNKYRNGLGELVEIEEDFLFPMMKSSDVASDSFSLPKRWMLVPQRSVKDETISIKKTAPKTWDYLTSHSELLNRRGSIIYKNRSQFAVFGVGEYSFANWKVAISGFYKKLSFKVVRPFEGKPVVLDDTSYFLSCRNKQEAEFLASILNSTPSQEFFQAFIFWDAKRPITVDLLSSIDIEKVVQCLGLHIEFRKLFKSSSLADISSIETQGAQLSLL